MMRRDRKRYLAYAVLLVVLSLVQVAHGAVLSPLLSPLLSPASAAAMDSLEVGFQSDLSRGAVRLNGREGNGATSLESSATIRPTRTMMATATETAVATSGTSTPSGSSTATATATIRPTRTIVATATVATATATATITATATATGTPAMTETPTATSTMAGTPTGTPTSLPTATATSTPGGEGYPELIGHSTFTDDAQRRTLPLEVPAGTVAGDLMLALVSAGHTGSSSDPTIVVPPDGWVLLRDDSRPINPFSQHHQVYVRTASEDEPSAYSWTLVDGTPKHVAGAMLVYRNAVVEVHNGQFATASSSFMTAPSVTLTSSTAILIFFGGINSRNSTGISITAPPGMMTLVHQKSGHRTQFVALENSAVVGATGDRTATLGDSNYWMASLLAITTGVD